MPRAGRFQAPGLVILVQYTDSAWCLGKKFRERLAAQEPLSFPSKRAPHQPCLGREHSRPSRLIPCSLFCVKEKAAALDIESDKIWAESKSCAMARSKLSLPSDQCSGPTAHAQGLRSALSM